MSDKSDKLDTVYDAAVELRYGQEAVAPGGRVREQFVDAVFDAKSHATQQEIADTINKANPNKPMSRQRVAQFIEEKKKSISSSSTSTPSI